MKRSHTLGAAAAAFLGLFVLAGCASDGDDAWDAIDRTFDDVGDTFDDAFGDGDDPDDRYHDPYDDGAYDD